ncbi:MAG: hypothetical protein AAGD96_00690, partial [Chloroflexota bacterium]
QQTSQDKAYKFVGFFGPFAMMMPKFKPIWWQWLIKEHGDIYPVLQKEIGIEGESIWEQRINTLEELEAWVNQVREKHSL